MVRIVIDYGCNLNCKFKCHLQINMVFLCIYGEHRHGNDELRENLNGVLTTQNRS